MEYARMRGYAEELTRHAPDPFRGYEISGEAEHDAAHQEYFRAIGTGEV